MKGNRPEQSGRDLFDRKPVRVALFAVIPVIIFILVCAGIRVSQYGIDHTIVVLGQKTLVAGSPCALRVTLISDAQGFFLPDSMDGHIVRGEERRRLFGGAVKDAGYALARNFRVPDMEPGDALLELEIAFDERTRVVTAPIRIVKGPIEEKLSVPEDAGKAGTLAVAKVDEMEVQAMTEDRGAPTGLSSVLFVRTLDSVGDPVKGEVDLKALEGESFEKLVTDRFGLAAFLIKPADLDHPIQVKGGKPTHLYPKVVYSGIGVVVNNPVVSKGEPIRLNIRQITRGGPVYADLFQNGSWIQAVSTWAGGDGGASIDLRPPVDGLVRVQISNFALDAGRTVAVRHVLVLKEGQDLNDGLRNLLEDLPHKGDEKWSRKVLAANIEGGVGFDRRLVSAFALSRMYQGHRELEKIVSSRKEDDAQLGEYKAGFQRMVMVVIVAVGVAVALLIGFIAAQSRRRQARITLMIAQEDGDLPSADAGTKGVARGVLQVITLLAIVVGAFASIALLIDTMTWGR